MRSDQHSSRGWPFEQASSITAQPEELRNGIAKVSRIPRLYRGEAAADLPSDERLDGRLSVHGRIGKQEAADAGHEVDRGRIGRNMWRAFAGTEDDLLDLDPRPGGDAIAVGWLHR